MQNETFTPAVLVVDDDPDIARLVGSYLKRVGFDAEWASEPALALEAAKRRTFHLLVMDYQLSGQTGLELAQQLQHVQGQRVPVVVMTAHTSVETAVAALRAGAADFVTKPFELSLLQVVVKRVLDHHQTSMELERLRTEIRRTNETHGLLGEHTSIQALRRLIDRLGPADGAVLVIGESGTGKELVARALHAAGKRSKGPMVAINCGAIPSTLLESELFGHVRGAFTGASDDRLGVFREADGGTLFLDEVGELTPALQTALLRVLQERTVRPVGANREVKVDVRVVAATNRDLQAAVDEGSFRQDLLFRLDVLRLDVPPLRERGDDVLLLLRHFLPLTCARHGKTIHAIAPEVTELCLRHTWPGNVRELQNVVERAVLACDGQRLEAWHLPQSVASPPAPKGIKESGWPLVTLAELERRHIGHVLAHVGGSKQRAADMLGIDRVTLYRKLKK
ncbi:MAG: sigma-54-dependent transcriptional regulator [Archangium sp.]